MTYHSGNNLIDPMQLLDKAQVHEGMHIADLGCGRTGHVVFPGSKVVGERGIVYAVDILKDVLENIDRRAAMQAIHNVHTVWADIEHPASLSIAPKTLNVAFLINLLYHFDDYDTALAEAARVLTEKSRMVIVDWQKKLANLGPQDTQLVDFDRVISWGRNNGFVIQEDFSAGGHHRGVVLYRH